jgi:protein-S-isoprenylcysteine O-methyltransferase Ste14
MIRNMTTDARGPGVRFPPPFVFVAGWLLAWGLDTRIEFLIDGAGAGPVQIAIGAALASAGLCLMFWGLVTFIYARTPVVPTRPARDLVRGGPYRYSRNPMYLGFTGLYAGLALLTNSAWPLVLLPVVLLALTSLVIRREEAHLQRMFGSDYDDYCRRVRRWI